MRKEELLEYGKNYMEQVGGFIKHNHYHLVELEENRCTMDAVINQDSLNPYGMVHGGFMFGLMDTATGVLARSGGRKAVTLSSHIQYLRSGYGSKINVVVTRVKDGRKISVYDACLFDDKDVLLAKASFEYCYID